MQVAFDPASFLVDGENDPTAGRQQLTDAGVDGEGALHFDEMRIDATVRPACRLGQGDSSDEVRRPVEDTDEKRRLGDRPHVESDVDGSPDEESLEQRTESHDEEPAEEVRGGDDRESRDEAVAEQEPTLHRSVRQDETEPARVPIELPASHLRGHT